MLTIVVSFFKTKNQFKFMPPSPRRAPNAGCSSWIVRLCHPCATCYAALPSLQVKFIAQYYLDQLLKCADDACVLSPARAVFLTNR